MIYGKRNILPVKEITGYCLGSNEGISTGAINRNLEHLLKNDDLLREKLEKMGLHHSIVLWTKASIYNPGDLVCYVHRDEEDNASAYILLCIARTHIEPIAVTKPDLTTLQSVGWKLVHRNTLYLSNESLLTKEILTPAVSTVILQHEKSPDHHCGTIIINEDDFGKVFLKKDLSNLASTTTNGSIGPSTYLNSSFADGVYSTMSSDGVREMQIRFGFDSVANQDIEILSGRYFYEDNPVKDKSDAHIFTSYYGEETQSVTLTNGQAYQNLRVPGTNVFSTTIHFDKPFKNTTYMVFQSAYLPGQFAFVQNVSELTNRTSGGNESFVGNILFTNKTVDSITAILPIHTHFSQYGQYVLGVPMINEFKITVVGVVK